MWRERVEAIHSTFFCSYEKCDLANPSIAAGEYHLSTLRNQFPVPLYEFLKSEEALKGQLSVSCIFHPNAGALRMRFTVGQCKFRVE